MPTGGAIHEVRFPSSVNRLYGLQWTSNLISGGWAALEGGARTWGTGDTMSLQDTNSAAGRFYRVRVEAP